MNDPRFEPFYNAIRGSPPEHLHYLNGFVAALRGCEFYAQEDAAALLLEELGARLRDRKYPFGPV